MTTAYFQKCTSNVANTDHGLCMVNEPTTDTNGDTVIADSYCQLNIFFKLNYDDDPLLRDLMVANITARKSLRIGMVKNNRSTGADAVLIDDFVSFKPM